MKHSVQLVRCRIGYRHLTPSIIFGSCVSLLLVVTWLLFSPALINSASAEEMRASVSTNATVTIKSTVSVALTSALDIAVLPKSEGAFNTGTANLRIATNNTSGYKAYIHTTSTDGALRALDKSNTRAILPLTGTMTSTNFSEHLNSWGYADTTSISPESASYAAVPTSSEPSALLESSAETSDDSYNLSFGTAVGIDLPAGEYQGSVTVSVVANPVEITNLSQLTYMQDMTPDICQNTMDYVDKNNYATKQLIDTRDGKSYWVAKLADGNCWMTQNLALTLNANTPLTASTSDVKQSRSLTTTSKTITARPGSQAGTYSWTLGQYVVKYPMDNTECTDTTGLTQCTNLVDVSGSDWQPTYIASMQPHNGVQQLVAVDEAAKTYDAHYLIGNYYQWNTTVVGTGGSKVNATMTESICPSQWKLPVAGDNTEGGSFAYLLKQYGFTEETNPVGGETAYDENALGYNATSAPLYLARGGAVAAHIGEMDNVGSSASYWSATAGTWNDQNSAMSYMLSVSTSDMLRPSYPSYRSHGNAVRCLAR